MVDEEFHLFFVDASCLCMHVFIPVYLLMKNA